MNYDSVIIGAGFAGLTAALKLAKNGQQVLLIAKGYGGTHLRTGAIDVLGYADGRRVARPLDELPAFAAARPSHPWALLHHTARESLAFFSQAMRDAGYPLAGDGEENFLLPTAIGVPRPTFLAPPTMAAGDLRAGGELLIVGFAYFKDFYPALIAENLNQARLDAPVKARAVTLEAPRLGDEADVAPMALARAFEQADFRAQLAEVLRPHLRSGERVGLPAALGVENALAVLDDLQKRLNAPVFEVPTLPPSIPGLRLYHALESQLRASGARIQIGHPVIGVQTEGRHVQAVVTQAASRPQVWRAGNFVLATGGVASGGIVVESDGSAREPLFNLPLANLPAPDAPRFSPGYFEEHPFNKVGVAVNANMQPLGADGPAFENLYVAGALLSGAEPWREKSGEGLSLASGYRAAQVIDEGRRTKDERRR